MASGGIGRDKDHVGVGRGRQSFLSKAQAKAKKDLIDGKQQSIERALRAVQAPKKG